MEVKVTMSELVKNNTVKMEWNKDEFLTKKNQAIGECFIAAWRHYQTVNGADALIAFRPGVAYAWGSLEDFPNNIVPMKSQISAIKAHAKDPSFPNEFDEFLPVALIQETGFAINPAVKEQFTDDQWKDIEARVNDLLPYSEEVEII